MTLEELIVSGRVLQQLAVPPFDAGTVVQHTGVMSGIVTLDFDGDTGKKMCARLGLIPHRETPRGFHIDVRWNKPFKSKSPINGLDMLGDGRMAVVLGSKGGLPYTWLRDTTPCEVTSLPEVFQRMFY